MPITPLLKKIAVSLLPYGAVRFYQNYKEHIHNPPRFYVVSPHGAGMQSFLYYLNVLGAPSTVWHDWKEGERLTPAHYPPKKTEIIHAYGVTCDQALPSPLAYAVGKQDVFWLIRDPVELLCSCINLTIGEYFNMSPCKLLMERNYNLDYFLIKNKRYYCMYTSQLKSVSASGDIRIIDTKELNPNDCFSTVSGALQNFDIKIDSIDPDIFKISYNSYKNRFWRNFPAIVMDQLNTPRFSIFVSPLHIWDYLYNHWSSSKIIDTLEIDNKKFAIIISTTEYNKLINCSETINLSNESKQSISSIVNNYTEKIEAASKLYDQHALSPDKLIDFFHSHPKYYDIFMKLLETELVMVEKLAPHKMEKWQSYKKLCR